MPHRTITFVEGEYYHVFNRGAFKQAIFYRHDAYIAFQQYLLRYASVFGIEIVAFCLMPNHFHLLIRVGAEGDVSEFMKRVCQTFSKRMNNIHKRSGTSFQGRFKAKHVEDTSYFQQVCMYIHANPVKSGLVEHPLHWEYSSFRETVDTKCQTQFSPGAIISVFGSPTAYEQEVVQYCSRLAVRHKGLTASLGEMGLL